MNKENMETTEMVLETMRSAGKPVEVGITRFISPTLEKQPQTSLKL